MNKSIAVITIFSLIIMMLIGGCHSKSDKEKEGSQTKEAVTSDVTSATAVSTSKATTATTKEETTVTETTTEEPVEVEMPIELEIPIAQPDGEEEQINQNSGSMSSSNEFSPAYGWVPDAWAKQVPLGMHDFVEDIKANIDYGRMNVFIGVTDLMNPDGYRHIDNSGVLHPSSVIKLWIAEYAFTQIANGNGNLDDRIGGSTLRYHIQEMMRMSDNGSTANVISYFGRANIDAFISANYGSTHLNADLRGNYYQGMANCTSVSDSIAILEKIWHNRESPIYAPIIELMFNSSTRAKLPSALAQFDNTHVASKTGSFVYYYAADHDIGIVVSYDDYGNIMFAYSLAIYTFSKPYEPTFSTARNTLFQVAFDVHMNFWHYALNPPIPPEPEPPPPEPEEPTETPSGITESTVS